MLHKPTTRVPAFDPGVIAAWAGRDLKVTDEGMIAQILDIYEQWYNSRRHIVEQASESVPGEADIAVSLDFNDKVKYTIVLDNSSPRLFGRKDNISKNVMREMTILQRAGYMLKPQFRSDAPQINGSYIQGKDRHDNAMLRLWASVTKEIQEEAHDDFITRVAILVGHMDPDKNHYWPSGFRVRNSEPYKKIKAHTALVERQKLRGVLCEFVSLLDRDALQVMRRANYMDSYAYTWLTGRMPEDLYTASFSDIKEPIAAKRASPEMRKRRQAAMLALPSLGYMMSDLSVEAKAFSAALDGGASLQDSVSSALATTPIYEQFAEPVLNRDMMRWLHGKTHRFVDGCEGWRRRNKYERNNWPSFVHDLTRLQSVPPEWRPTTPDTLSHFSTLAYHAGEYETLTGRPKKELFREFMSVVRKPAGLPQGWLTQEDTAEKGQFLYTLETKINLSNQEMKDFIDRAGEQLIMPEIVRMSGLMGIEEKVLWGQEYPEGNRVMRGSLSCLFRDMSIVKLQSLQMRWHKHMHRLDERTKTYNTDAEWLALFPPMTLDNGVTAACLTSSSALIEEGYNMQHCVGGYAHRCLFGSSHIISLKAGDGTWATTLELRVENQDGKTVISVGQHMGPGNRGVHEHEAQESEKLVIAHVAKNEPDWAAMETIRKEQMVNKMLMRVGFDPLDDKACDDAYAAWHGTFRDVFPESTRAGFLVRSNITGKIGEALKRHAPL